MGKLLSIRCREAGIQALKSIASVAKQFSFLRSVTLGLEFRTRPAQMAADLAVDTHAIHVVLERYLRKQFKEVVAKINIDKVSTEALRKTENKRTTHLNESR